MIVREFTGKMALAASQYGKERDYWLNKLSGDPVKTRFPYDWGNTGYQLEASHISLKGELFGKLMKVSKTSDYTLHMVLTAGLTALLGKYTTHNDIIVGMPIYNQDKEGECSPGKPGRLPPGGQPQKKSFLTQPGLYYLYFRLYR
jgi:hypothetical protein